MGIFQMSKFKEEEEEEVLEEGSLILAVPNHGSVF